MKITKELTNEEPFDPLTSITFANGKYIDLHNDFFFADMVFNNSVNMLIVTFGGDNEGEKVFVKFITVKELEISFRFNEAKDDEKILLDMFARGEDARHILPEDRYFFIDFTNGLHMDCNCETCILEYEKTEE